MRSYLLNKCRITVFLVCFAIGLLLTVPAIAFSPLQQAQNLNAEGKQQLEQGQPNTALKLWQQSEVLYRQSKDTTGVLGAQLNQAKALQSLGFYRRSQELLERVEQSLRSHSDSTLKANTLLTLGNGFRLLGDFERSQQVLEASFAIAKRLRSPSDIQAAALHLGNTLTAQKQFSSAQSAFEQAIQTSGTLKSAAQLQLLKLFLQTNRTETAIALLDAIQPTNLYEQIELAKLLRQVKPQETMKAAQWLARSIQEAESLHDDRSQSFAFGQLGQLYEQTQQFKEAHQLTQKALNIAKNIQVPELIYQWQWQLGRILIAEGEQRTAKETYIEAVTTLKSLRQDLVAINQDVQFSFREQVEPVYRELVDLLLQNNASQADLKQARQTIEALQVAELNNFFREACLDVLPQAADEIDQTAAVIYPIILPDRLEVILSVPNQPLQRYTTQLPRIEVEAAIARMIRSMRSTSFRQEQLSAAQPLYRWLIQPAIVSLTQHSIQTLVFVMDGNLRRLPIAALHNGQNYLIEQYAIALTPSLHLFNSGVQTFHHPSAIIAGVSKAVQGLEALPGVQQEVSQIRQRLAATVLMNQDFTVRSLTKTLQSKPVKVLHLATHGQFGATAQNTFIQTWDGKLNLNDMQVMLRNVPIELLVLSACETAKGDDRASLGMAGVAVRSGARSTLATLWRVNDASTAQFINTFYEQLSGEKISRSQALRQAQLSLLKNRIYEHPFYWASFVLVGNWQ